MEDSKYTRAGQLFKLEPWQELATRLIWGVVDDEGLRRYRNVYCEIPRKNGKTTLAAAWAVLELFTGGENAAQCYCAAADKDQASLLYRIVASMIEKSKLLKTEAVIRQSQKVVRYGGSTLRALSSDAHTKHGFNSHFIVMDELHAHKSRELFDVLKTSTGARSQPLMMSITTAGHDKNSICWEQHEYARRVRDGEIDDPHFLPMLYGCEEKDDWTSEEVWKKANPNYGVSLSTEYMQAQCREAQANPAYQNTFRNLHLNQWTSQKVRWLMMSDWDSCRDMGELDKSLPAYGGLDLSSTTDITAWAIAQPTDGGGYRMKWRLYVPEERIERAEARDGVPYRRWREDGWITATPGARVDYAFIEADVLRDCDEYGVGYVGFDPWNAEYMQQRLDAAGVNMVSVRQGFASMSEPSKNIEAAVASRTFGHGGNPVMRWMAESCEIQMDPNGNIRPVKDKGRKRIDGIVAAINAVAVALAAPSSPKYDYYETNSIELM